MEGGKVAWRDRQRDWWVHGRSDEDMDELVDDDMGDQNPALLSRRMHVWMVGRLMGRTVLRVDGRTGGWMLG